MVKLPYYHPTLPLYHPGLVVRPWKGWQRWRGGGCGVGAHPLFLPGWREEQQGEEGGKGREGGHPLFVPGEGDEQGKGKGRQEMEWGRSRDTGRGNEAQWETSETEE